ncbi:MAG: GreA/GreB family elongation factor [Dehalococcoidia bacterium]
MQAQETLYLTREAMKALKEELDYLRITRRREIADMLRESRENDYSVEADAPYDPARDEQAFVEGRILELEQMLANAQLIDEKAGKRAGRVALGSKVVVEDARGRSLTYQIVDSAETDPSQGKVSDASPIGKALLGAAPGDTVTVHAPAGPKTMKVRELR